VLETPHVEQTAMQLTACLHLNIPRAHIREVMGPGLAEVRATLAAQHIAPTGPWLTHHLQMPADVFDFEICLPVAVPIVATGRVKPGRLPAATVARAVYRGPYEGLGEAWAEVMAWIAANGHRPAPDFTEQYLVGPESGQVAAEWRTQLTRPLFD